MPVGRLRVKSICAALTKFTAVIRSLLSHTLQPWAKPLPCRVTCEPGSRCGPGATEVHSRQDDQRTWRGDKGAILLPNRDMLLAARREWHREPQFLVTDVRRSGNRLSIHHDRIGGRKTFAIDGDQVAFVTLYWRQAGYRRCKPLATEVFRQNGSEGDCIGKGFSVHSPVRVAGFSCSRPEVSITAGRCARRAVVGVVARCTAFAIFPW